MGCVSSFSSSFESFERMNVGIIYYTIVDTLICLKFYFDRSILIKLLLAQSLCYARVPL